jgi:hypothetical protein
VAGTDRERRVRGEATRQKEGGNRVEKGQKIEANQRKRQITRGAIE